MLEIEKKYLIKELPTNIEHYKKEEIVQGYSKENGQKTIRIRKTITKKNGRTYTKHYMTQKRGKGLVREEKEEIISEKSFEEKFKKTQGNSIEKTRYFIPYKKSTIELNHFHKQLQGLRVAEVEFGSLEESKLFIPPDRFGEEITEYKEAENGYLAKHGMKKLITKTQSENLIKKFQIKDFYNNQTKKYTETRKKYRTEGKNIGKILEDFQSPSIKILEIGCGSGRLLEYLASNTAKEIKYTGVDLSEGLLHEAEKIKIPANIDVQFICEDMINYLAKEKQESYDIIIGIASIQHLPSQKERFLCMKYIYRLLKYEGLCITINWSFSYRMIKKYWKEILHSLWKYMLGKDKRNDILLPWKNQNEIFYRFYHIFTKKEIKEIALRSGFVVNTCDYLDQQGSIITSRKNAKSTILVAKKSI